MQRWTLLFLLSMMALPVFALGHTDLKHFHQELAEARGRSDEQLARWLVEQQLGERMSLADLAQLTATMPGPESKKALAMVADASAFLDVPAGSDAQQAAMSAVEQKVVLSRAADYIGKTLARLPNFFATESVATYEDTPAFKRGNDFVPAQRLHYVNSRSVTVLYRNGREVMEANKDATAEDQTITRESGLLSSGEFGPVLRTVLADAHTGKLTWSHWEVASEPGQASPVAVFKYSVPRSKSHYRVKLQLPGSKSYRHAQPGYHGEITIDPTSGTILRLTLFAELTDDDPMSQADLMVEYAPVTIGDQSYICPARSVARTQVPQWATAADGLGYIGRDKYAQYQTQLNDVHFDRYHLMHSDVQIITGAGASGDGPQSDAPKR